MDADAYARMQRDASDPLGVELTVTIRLHRNGAMSIEGPTGDKAFFLHLLDEARAAVARQQRELPALVVPGGDVDSKPREEYRCRS